jgi:hypothetical protein
LHFEVRFATMFEVMLIAFKTHKGIMS